MIQTFDIMCNTLVLDWYFCRHTRHLAEYAEPDASALALSRSLGVARNTVHARLPRLESSGALGSFTRRLRGSTLGYSLTALVSISVLQTIESGLFTIPEVVEVHATTGDADLEAKVLTMDTTDFHRIKRRS